MQGCPSSLIGNGPVTLSEGLSLLVSEHGPLRKQLEALFSFCNQVKTTKEKETSFNDLIKEVTEFSSNLEFHSAREEDILFRMMEVYLGKEGGPIAVMEYEHEQAKGYINTFLSNAENRTQSEEEMIQNAGLIIDAYHTLLDHFMKEEQVLYPFAEKLFTAEEKELLNEKVSTKSH
ncbi:hemerythrin domain-containing protein [Niallia sp. Krafla_26]|uniref:hemerythrin domain-containing protein n=1 Tax=Niallia sp. Krafla_26 TaxID=3064703 RepID=UPI003D165227